ncbi:MAG: gamma-glutamylcyclotransferase family protein [Woeseiaceae bacterium]|nr:gamma-glutamylcyclotransferase family protein [Woeseiaceae bacterium]
MDDVSVFFYGLFMDEALLASKDVHPTRSAIGYVDGFRLHIGERASLLPEAGSRAYGVLMDVARPDLAKLYSDAGVADYEPEPVTVYLPGDVTAEAVCYNLPASKLTGTNPEYAAALLELSGRLGFPAPYVDHIERMLLGCEATDS